MSNRNAPIAWPDLKADLAKRAVVEEINLSSILKELDDHVLDDFMVGVTLWGGATSLVRTTIADTRNVMEAHYLKFVPRALAIAQSKITPKARYSRIWLAALLILDLGVLAGWRKDDGESDDLIKKILSVGPFNKENVSNTIWAGLAHGQSERLRPFLAVEPEDVTTEPNMEFSDNVERMQFHLWHAITTNADQDTTARAYAAMHETFPLQLATETSGWQDLLWAARAHYVAIGNGAPEDTLAQLRSDIA